MRSQAPVSNKVAPNEYAFLGKALIALGAIKPEGTKGTPPQIITPDLSIEYGSYLANSVANWVGCQSERDLKTGKI